jgi:LAO/AO transport system kinase
MAAVPSLDLVAGVLAGETRAIARMLTRAEAADDEGKPALEAIFRRAGRAHVIGITGVPGSGKSTLVAKLTAEIRRTGRRVGVVAIDPSSPFSGGAILGDRIRMGDISSDPGVFVRSMATRGALGGLARGTLDAVDILDAAGFETVVIETVGVGQDEVDVARAAHTTVVVSSPGLGDDIQAIKAGILEIADIHVVGKSDRPDADKTVVDLKSMLALGVPLQRSGSWRPPVLKICGLSGDGVAVLRETIDTHRAALEESGAIVTRRAEINERRLLLASEDAVRKSFLRQRDGHVAGILRELNERRIGPHTAAKQLLERLHKEEHR